MNATKKQSHNKSRYRKPFALSRPTRFIDDPILGMEHAALRTVQVCIRHRLLAARALGISQEG